MAKKLSLFKREPIAIIGVVAAIIPVLMALGLIDGKLGGALGALVVAAGALFGRSQVASVESVAQTAVRVAQGLGAGNVGAVGSVTQAGLTATTGAVEDVMGVTTDVAKAAVGGALDLVGGAVGGGGNGA